MASITEPNESNVQEYAAAIAEIERQARALKEIFDRLPASMQKATFKPTDILSRVGTVCRCTIKGEPQQY